MATSHVASSALPVATHAAATTQSPPLGMATNHAASTDLPDATSPAAATASLGTATNYAASADLPDDTSLAAPTTPLSDFNVSETLHRPLATIWPPPSTPEQRIAAMATAPPPPPSAAAAPPPASATVQHGLAVIIASLLAKMEKLEASNKRLEEALQERDRSHRRQTARPRRPPSRARQASPARLGSTRRCWYHRRFGTQALRCASTQRAQPTISGIRLVRQQAAAPIAAVLARHTAVTSPPPGHGTTQHALTKAAAPAPISTDLTRAMAQVRPSLPRPAKRTLVFVRRDCRRYPLGSPTDGSSPVISKAQRTAPTSRRQRNSATTDRRKLASVQDAPRRPPKSPAVPPAASPGPELVTVYGRPPTSTTSGSSASRGPPTDTDTAPSPQPTRRSILRTSAPGKVLSPVHDRDRRVTFLRDQSREGVV